MMPSSLIGFACRAQDVLTRAAGATIDWLSQRLRHVRTVHLDAIANNAAYAAATAAVLAFLAFLGVPTFDVDLEFG